MPARLDLTPEQVLERMERRREQTRQAVQRYRARQKALVSITVSLTTASLRARDDVRSPAPVTTTTSPSPPSSPTRPNKSGELIDLLRAAGVAHDLNPKDHAALKRSALSAAQVAEVYCAIARHEFGDDWLCKRLSVTRAIETWPGYANEKTRGPHAAARRKSNGTQVLEVFGYAGD
jgi:hypothetical protein